MHNGKSAIITSLNNKVNVWVPHPLVLLKTAQLFMSSIEHKFEEDRSVRAPNSVVCFSAILMGGARFSCPKGNQSSFIPAVEGKWFDHYLLFNNVLWKMFGDIALPKQRLETQDFPDKLSDSCLLVIGRLSRLSYWGSFLSWQLYAKIFSVCFTVSDLRCSTWGKSQIIGVEDLESAANSSLAYCRQSTRSYGSFRSS